MHPETLTQPCSSTRHPTSWQQQSNRKVLNPLNDERPGEAAMHWMSRMGRVEMEKAEACFTVSQGEGEGERLLLSSMIWIEVKGIKLKR